MKFELVLVACVEVAYAEKFEVSIDMFTANDIIDLPNHPDVRYKKNGDDDYTVLS